MPRNNQFEDDLADLLFLQGKGKAKPRLRPLRRMQRKTLKLVPPPPEGSNGVLIA